jgi:DUF4097 and DUF4098 domain-containing protein YvlB
VKKNRNQLVAITMMALALGSSAFAQSTYCDRGPCQVNVKIYRSGGMWMQEITGEINAAKGVKLESAFGSVQMRGNNQPNVTYTVVKKLRKNMSEEQAKREFAQFELEVVRRGPEVVYFNADWNGGSNSKVSAEFYVNVPRQTQFVKVHTMGGSVDVKAIAGKAYLETLGGSVTVDDIGGDVIANTQGGSIDVGDIGGSVKLETAGGSIGIGSVSGPITAQTSGGSIQVGSGKQNVWIETAGGSISVKECHGTLTANTAGGSIDVGSVAKAASVETAGGGIRVGRAGATLKAVTAGGGLRLMQLTSGVHAETAAGGIEAEFIAGRGQFTDSHLETSSGDIVVYLPSDLPVTVKAAIELANGHRIDTGSFTSIRVSSEGGTYGPKTIWAEGSLNGGGPVLKVHTTNGSIVFRQTSNSSARR